MFFSFQNAIDALTPERCKELLKAVAARKPVIVLDLIDQATSETVEAANATMAARVPGDGQPP